jgi:hypothetical protein
MSMNRNLTSSKQAGSEEHPEKEWKMHWNEVSQGELASHVFDLYITSMPWLFQSLLCLCFCSALFSSLFHFRPIWLPLVWGSLTRCKRCHGNTYIGIQAVAASAAGKAQETIILSSVCCLWCSWIDGQSIFSRNHEGQHCWWEWRNSNGKTLLTSSSLVFLSALRCGIFFSCFLLHQSVLHKVKACATILIMLHSWSWWSPCYTALICNLFLFIYIWA